MYYVMKMIDFLFVICVFSVFTYSCDDDDGSNDLFDEYYTPIIDSDNFKDGVDHEYFPLNVGDIYTYEAETEDGTEIITVTVTNETKIIMGVTCMVVNDRVELEGELVENTNDWYAQDNDGNVWYMGEYSEEWENGKLQGVDGSWEAGVDGAYPGIIMPANPILGIPYRQEYYYKQAEDWGKIVEIGVTVETPYGTFTNCIKTEDWNALEPGIIENKYYAPGIGVVKEEDVDNNEIVELMNISQSNS